MLDEGPLIGWDKVHGRGLFFSSRTETYPAFLDDWDRRGETRKGVLWSTVGDGGMGREGKGKGWAWAL
jgi:hypothetical protein